MPVSRLRLTLALWFGAALLVALAAFDVSLYAFLRNVEDRELTTAVRTAAAALSREIARERQTGLDLPGAIADALTEWPDAADAFAVAMGDSVIGTRGPAVGLRAIRSVARIPSRDTVWNVELRGERGARLASNHDDPQFVVVAARTTETVERYASAVLHVLLVTAPAIVLFALGAGYLFARGALRPLDRMGTAMDAMEPGTLARLTVRTPPDELDRLAERFNALLDRLERAQEQNRAFVAQAAHQLRTPLTVVRGESDLSLERPRAVESYRESLDRIRRAAEQMSSRVNDLLLLAQAEAGETPTLTDDIELDAVALECADLMRRRAQQAGHRLELDRVEAATARGNDRLVREALTEMIENALRHGEPGTAITISAFCEDAHARVTVRSAGAVPAPGGASGLGLSILRWIAERHGGTFALHSQGGVTEASLTWPAEGS